MESQRCLRIAHLLAVVSLLLTGCQSLPPCASIKANGRKPKLDPELLSQHVIEVNADGFLLDLRPRRKPRAIQSRQQLKAYLEDTIFAAFEKSGKQKLLLFIHGGLNDREEGMAHFWSNYEQILQGEYYPEFVVW